ncbi:MAG: site-2 protease family protein [Verrucomicrobia bacterium]|nr:site-2 protease family protein [Verrucomicrobiota bacterium]
MIFTILHILLAAFGLGFLIFIHEFGHFWVARRQGMTVEAFSIGFGDPLFAWERNGVKWQIGWLPFGGYVRIAGMEKKGALEPHQIPDGFFGKKPLSRIKVALAGPIVNIAFAFFAFCALWFLGGRQKPFSEFTHLIGSVDPTSAAYHADIRPGDVITNLNHKPFGSFQDLLYAAILDETPPVLGGEKVDYLAQTKSPFTFQFTYDKDANVMDRAGIVMGSVRPAGYVLYKPYADGTANPIPADSPMAKSGIANGDRILWADGAVIFSKQQLIETVNEPKALLTLSRGGKTLLARIPRLKVADLRLTPLQKEELGDWQHAAQLAGKLSDLFFIPYNLTASCIVENPLSYLNEETIEQEHMATSRAPLESPLQVGDQILAVDGIAVTSSAEMLRLLQTRHIQIIVKHEGTLQKISSKEADKAFIGDIDWNDLEALIQSIGTPNGVKERGNLRLLNPVAPKPLDAFELPKELSEKRANEIAAEKKVIEEMKDPEAKKMALRDLEESQKRVLLGIVLLDREVTYNPSPFVLFGNVFKETWRTLVSLFTGNLSPKWLSGPVGIVQVMQHSWGVGIKEALFWLGMISLNLGILNLLPIPVLDGGHICFSLWESVTGKPISAKTMEKLIIPFVILLIAFFIYLTYHDLARLFTRFF